MKSRYEKLSQDSIISPKNKRNINHKFKIIVIILSIILIAESIVLYIVTNKVKDQKIVNERKSNYKESLKNEIKEMYDRYDERIDRLKSYSDYKNSKLSDKQSMKDKITKENEQKASLFSQLEKKKLNNRKSLIMSQNDILKIEKWTRCNFGKLCYSGLRDGFSPKVFHSQCDGIKPTVTLIKADEGEVLGGFTRSSWDGDELKFDNTAFLFSLLYDKVYPIINNMPAINASPDYLPCFGVNDILLSPTNSSLNEIMKSYRVQGQNKNAPDTRFQFEFGDIEVFRMRCVIVLE